MIRTLLVEDQKITTEYIRAYLKGNNQFEIVTTITNAAMAELSCMEHNVDLVLMDICTDNNESGLKYAEEIKRHLPKIKIIIITSMVDYSFIEKAKQANIESFWHKEESPMELLEIMEGTMTGKSIYPKSFKEVKIGKTTSSQFTYAEMRVLRLLVTGLTDAEISKELDIAITTVRYHVKSLFQKTGYNNRVSLASDVINKNLIVPHF